MDGVRVICCDIDGTLLRDDKSLSEENIKWIKKAVDEAGVHFTLVSGRMPGAVRPFYDRIGITGPISCYNGGTLVDFDGRIISEMRIPHDIALKLCDIQEKFSSNTDIILFNGVKWYLRTRDCYSYAPKFKIYGYDCELGNPRELLNQFDTNKVNIMSPSSETLDEVWDCIKRELPPGSLTIYKTLDFLEIMPAGCSKANAIKALSDYFKVPASQIMALGDDCNDAPMMQAAGYSVAMGNAVPETKAAAKYVTATNTDDGVAKAIKRYVFGL